MYLTEEYTMYKLAHNLVTKEGYDVLHINTEAQELWLEKNENKVSKVIRLIHKGFDWKNHLKTDIARVFQRTKAMEKMLIGKTIEIYNIYISAHTPVEDWEDLKRPLQLNAKNPIKMNVFYLTNTDYEEEMLRLQAEVGGQLIEKDQLTSDSEKESTIKEFQIELSSTKYNAQKKKERVFSFGKPLMTYILIIINIIMFILLEVKGGSTNTEVLIEYGAKYNPAILDGEWWRIISSMFLHIGVFHLFMNMLALYYLGLAVERIFGSWRFTAIYFLAGIGGGLTSFAFSMSISAGASGAIFGLFGALLFFGTVHKKIFLQTMGRGILMVLVLNLVIGFTIPNIDMGAHLGGLVTGFLASAIFHLPENKNFKLQLLALIAYGFLLFGLVVYGINATNNSVAYQVVLVEEAIIDEDFDTVIDITTDALEKESELDAELLFQRSYAYIHLSNSDAAIIDLERSVEIKKNYAEAYHNLALLYSEKGKDKKAIDAAEKALKLNPEDENYMRLLEQVTGDTSD